MNATVNFEVCQSDTEATKRKDDLEKIGFRVTLVPGTPEKADIIYVRYPGASGAKEVRIDTCPAPYLLVAVKQLPR